MQRPQPTRLDRSLSPPTMESNPRVESVTTTGQLLLEPSSIPMRESWFAAMPMTPVLGGGKFTKEARKYFQSTARFYSECTMRGIEPEDAEKAVAKVEDQYGKWWSKTHQSWQAAPSSLRKRPHGDQSEASPPKESNKKVKKTPFLYTIEKHQSSRPSNVSDCDDESVKPTSGVTLNSSVERIRALQAGIIEDLQKTRGDTSSQKFLDFLDILKDSYRSQGCDARWTNTNPFSNMDGVWLTLSKATYTDCLGLNEDGDSMYTLGRLAFDMFRPTGLRSSVQGIFQRVEPDTGVHHDRPRAIPSRLLQERQARHGAPAVRLNDILIYFTIEPDQTRRGEQQQQQTATQESYSTNGNRSSKAPGEYIVRTPLRGLLTNFGYCLPDPEVPNRLTVWFCGGRLEPDLEGEEDTMGVDVLTEWKKLFDAAEVPSRNFQEQARILAARCFLGANLPEIINPDGSMSYSLHRPIGGHGRVYVDVLYCDSTMRIIQGHRGSIFVSIRPLDIDPEES